MSQQWVRIPDKLRPYAPILDPGVNTVSTGNASIDGAIGGFPRGSLVLLEFDLDVHQDVVRCIELSMIADFLSKERGVVWLPMYATDYKIIGDQIGQLVGPKVLSSSFRMLETEAKDINYPFVSTIEGSDAQQDLSLSSLRYMLGDSKEPFLSILGYDAMEPVYGPGVFKDTLPHIDSMRRGGNIVIAIASSMSQSLPSLREQAKMHIKFENMAGCIMACGQKPRTPYYYLDTENAEGRLPAPRLMPMI